MTSINFSIIIPHHNIPHLLDRCLRSIPLREDVQVIVVDDCSDAPFSQQVKTLESNYPAAKFIYSPVNGGGGAARNIGMQYAQGRYLVFADADDYFSDNFSSILDSHVTATEDIIYFRNYNVSSNNCNIFLDHTKWIDDIFDRYEQSQDFSEVICLITNPWAKLFRRKFIVEHNFHFDETPVANDVFFVVSASCYAQSRVIKRDVIYYYTTRDDSITASYFEKQEVLSVRMDICYRAQQLMKQFGYKIRSMPLSYYLYYSYRSDTSLYKEYLKNTPAVYNSLRDALFQIRCFIPNHLEKIALYVRSFLWFYT